MKKIILLSLISFQLTLVAQEKSDSTKATKAESESIFKTGPGTSGKDTITDTGVAMSPSSMYFKAKPGRSETLYLTITNDQKRSEKFKISFQDYTMDNMGRNTPVPFGSIAPYGLSNYIVAAPTLVDLKPGEKKKVAITVSMPETDVAYKAAWTQLMVDRVHDRAFLLPDKSNDKAVKMGVIPTYGFGIHVYQNPPNVKLNKVEILKFNFTYDDSSKYVALKVKNSGDGMGFCKSYVEINNINTGKIEKHLLKQFVVFPGLERSFDLKVPGKINPGKYSILLVLDFGSKEELEVAEMELNVQ